MQFFTFNNIYSSFNMFCVHVHMNVLSSILSNIFSVTWLPSTFCMVWKSDKPGDVNFWGEYQVHQKFVLSQCLLEVNNLWLLLTLTKNEGDIQPEFQVILNFCCTAKCAAFIFVSAAVSHCLSHHTVLFFESRVTSNFLQESWLSIFKTWYRCFAKCAAFIFASAAVSHCPIIQFCFLKVEWRLTFNKSLDWQF